VRHHHVIQKGRVLLPDFVLLVDELLLRVFHHLLLLLAVPTVCALLVATVLVLATSERRLLLHVVLAAHWRALGLGFGAPSLLTKRRSAWVRRAKMAPR
jgi:hypothetical protein